MDVSRRCVNEQVSEPTSELKRMPMIAHQDNQGPILPSTSEGPYLDRL